jgi:hypothetical protein
MRSSIGPTVWLSLTIMFAACHSQGGPHGKTERRTQLAMADEQNQGFRRALLEELRPVTLKNCSFKRFGSPNDGGYVMCENLNADAESAYSYGIGGNDDWGCEISSTYRVAVHQYDCFNPPELSCKGGRFVPHTQCVGPKTELIDSRPFDTLSNQISKNGDFGKRLIVKMDVEGAEWASLLATPDEVLERIDQLPIELHGVSEPRFLELVQKLKRGFYLVHLHFNNWACAADQPPFPASVYQVLFVNKRIGVVGTPKTGSLPAQAFDAPDNPNGPDCQLRPS